MSKLDPRHPNLFIDVPLTFKRHLTCKSRVDYNYFKADYSEINADLCKINWSDKLSIYEDVDVMVESMYENLYNIIEAHVPKRKSHKSRHPPWYSQILIRLKLEEDKIRRKYLKFNNPMDKIEYDIIRKRCKKLIHDCYNTYKSSLENNIKNNPKAFWRFVKDKRKGTSSIPAQMFLHDQTVSTGPDIANLFAEHFSSLYTSSSCDAPPSIVYRRHKYTSKRCIQ